MSDSDHAHEAVERLEFMERTEKDRPGFDRRAFLRRTALTGVAAGSVGTILSACGSSGSNSSSASGGSSSAGIFGIAPQLQIHVRQPRDDEPVLRAHPVRGRGRVQTARLLLPVDRLGKLSNVSQMVNALNSAVTSGVDGIGVSLVDPTAFNSPVASAIKAGIPVVAYNADATGNPRLAYIGQDLEVSGEQMGEHIAELVPEGEVALFIATPGQLNIQPRINGAIKTLKKHSSITTHTITTGASVPGELTVIDSYLTGHPNTKGMFAVDAGSTEGVAKTIQKHGVAGKVKGGGYDLLEVTEQLLAAGDIAVHDRPAALPAGLPADPRAVPLPGVEETVGHRRRRHRPEVPDQGNRRAVQQHEKPLRGNLLGGRSLLGSSRGGRVRQPDSRTSSSRGPGPAPRPRRERVEVPPRRAHAARGQHHRRHDRDDHLLRGRTRTTSSRPATSRRCCRTSRRSRSSARARCS